MMLHDLNDENIQIPQDKLADWVFSATSRFLVDNQSNGRSWFVGSVLVALLVGAVIGILLQKYFWMVDCMLRSWTIN